MTLRETLKETTGKVNIGMLNGFVYCDENTEETLIILEALSIIEYRTAKERLETLENHLEHFESDWRKKKDATKQELENRKKADKKNTKDAIKKLKPRIENWKDFLDREVITTTKAVLSENTLNIVCEGEESGKYWDHEEYMRDRDNLMKNVVSVLDMTKYKIVRGNK